MELPIGTVDDVTALRVRPRGACWSVAVRRPELSPAHAAEVECVRLPVADPGLAGRGGASWAGAAMGFERVPPHYLGSGTRIALIDSGAQVRHPDLGDRVNQGWDAVSGDAKAWDEDVLGSGTHCATVIVGSAT